MSDLAGFYPELDFDEYLASDALSSTLARLLTKHVPAKAIEKARNNKPTKAMNLGSAAHSHALGTGPQLIVWQYDGRTKDGKAERADAAELIATQTAVAVTADEHRQITGMAKSLRSDTHVWQILERSQDEVSAFWNEGNVPCRARFDLLADDGAWDYKTTQDASQRGFTKAMGSFLYNLQADFYERALAALNHPAAGRPLRFICQETERPYLVQIHWPDEMASEAAKLLNDRAIGIYEACTRTGEWPPYESLYGGPAPLPAYFFYDYAEALPDVWRPLEQEIVI